MNYGKVFSYYWNEDKTNLLPPGRPVGHYSQRTVPKLLEPGLRKALLKTERKATRLLGLLGAKEITASFLVAEWEGTISCRVTAQVPPEYFTEYDCMAAAIVSPSQLTEALEFTNTGHKALKLTLILQAPLPEDDKALLREMGVIKTHYSPGSTYESATCEV